MSTHELNVIPENDLDEIWTSNVPPILVHSLWFHHYLHNIISGDFTYYLVPLMFTVMTFKTNLYAAILYGFTQAFDFRRFTFWTFLFKNI